MDTHMDHKIIKDNGADIYDEAMNVGNLVKHATINTLMNKRLGLAGSIAYIDKGAALYEEFKKSHLPKNDPSQSASAQLIDRHKASLTHEMQDIGRLIVVGGGSYDSITNQELILADNLFAHENKPPLKEIVLVDVSLDFLKQGIQAAKDFREKHKRPDIRIIPIRADFKNVSGVAMDTIMARYGAAPRDEIKAAVMMTGATFGNIEGVSAVDKFPGNEIDIQMAHLGELAGKNSIVMFDHFTKIEAGENYYTTPELAKFFNNIPVIMQQHCSNLQGLYAGENYFRYRAKMLPNARMVAHELIAETPQTPRIVNGAELIMPIATGDTLNVMFSLMARTDDIANRPDANTGLKKITYVSSPNDLVMHVFQKTSLPTTLHHPDIEMFHPRSNAPSHIRESGSPGLAAKVLTTMDDFKRHILALPRLRHA